LEVENYSTKIWELREPWGSGRGIMRMEDLNANSESTLIRQAQAGDTAAFQRLAEQQAPPLLRSAFVFCRDHQQAEDLAQETLVEAYRSLDRFDGRCRFSTWLFGILRHRFLKLVRRQPTGRETAITTEQAEQAPLQDRRSPVTQLEQKEEAVLVRQAVAALPEEHREVVELRFFADISLPEIAVVLNVPLGTVKSRLHYGLEKLRQQNLLMNLLGQPGESSTRTQ
jgi:RNA polymerase sigma-70 factor, ECF subfamily